MLAYADTFCEGDCGAVTVKIGKIKTKLRNINIVSMGAS
jgi:xanthine dehydrogenase iron-sulfur cluster and FAD-binding subunit A